MLFRKRLKKVTVEQERDFKERMEHVPLLDKLIMIGTAFVVIVIPCALVLIVMTLIAGGLLGLL